MSEIVQYAVIDGSIEEGLLDFLAEHDAPHCCLYAEPLQQELIPLAPYLVEVTQEVSSWLVNKTSPWGIYLFTSVSMKDLRQHLRKYLQVLLPSEDKPVFFRFYDPRNIWDLCHVLSEWELHCFMGPIEKMMTVHSAIIREEHFQPVRAQFPPTAKSRMKLFRISQPQLDLLNHYAEMKYIGGLTTKTITQYAEKIQYVVPHTPEWKMSQTEDIYNGLKDSPERLTVNESVSECYHFCKAKGIEDDRAIRGLLHLLIEKEMYSLKKIPPLWLDLLSNENFPGHYRVERLLKDTLGYIPR
ncbi:DUF4123 domain-containing protein [Pectobacterium sp. FL60-S17]|uniref:DUF4123 domain-containing protein n=2 Tax=Pectobacterium TaxID=122277 RepID=A0A9Q2ICU4_9GAMM|nr:DUF4123 domain-containing protein [Pectobacterium quasiaquaticum]MBN3065093.1 DUF4123 domain-containing protein [Pectobacterium aquaticum]MBE5203352.1 DUF4123 domain-containing protein [Pectobacterium quasiaquaticum]MBE5208710.1 DUF4123 domain-containing protein [Pectobacterium quasiaquaticum]MBE5215280.1 DUF4123 domain-containing protein [Pectobacterium quasiaquaticum]MBE5221120.1 DUF4123 domain-containing protein [Pectobacterium quasiaquaticum]